MSKLKDPSFYKEKQKYAFEEQKKNEYTPYPHKRPGPNVEDKRKTNIIPDVKLRLFNWASNTADLKDIHWNKIEALAISEGGSQGVLFIETDDGSLVLKGSTDIAVEWYLQKLQKILKIPVPEMKLINWSDPDFRKITNEIERAAFTDELLYYRIKPRIDMAYLLAMEYIPGVNIDRLGLRRAAHVFTHQTPESRDRLIRLGFVLVFDTFINNYDRFPCGSIWDNDGNIGNVVLKAKTTYTTDPDVIRDPNDLTTEFERFYAIDPRVSLVNVRSKQTKEVLEKYYAKVEDFLNNVMMEIKEVMEARIDPFFEDFDKTKLGSIKRFSTFIYNYTGYQLKEIQLLQVMIGIGIGMHNIVELNIDRVGALYIEMFMKDKTKDWRGYWDKNLEQINIEVLADVLKIYTKLSGVYPDVIQWLNNITLGEYKVDIIEWEKAMGIYENNQDEDEKKFQDQYTVGVVKTESSSDEEGNQTDEDYDKMDDFNKKINDLFYLDVNQLEEDIKKGRDVSHYDKTTNELAQLKPDRYEN